MELIIIIVLVFNNLSIISYLVVFVFLSALRIDIFMRLIIIRHNSTAFCSSSKTLSKIWFYVIYYVDCQLDTILCLDLVFGIFGIQCFGHLVPQLITAPIVLMMSIV